MTNWRSWLGVAFVGGALLALACDGGDGAPEATPTEPALVETPLATATPGSQVCIDRAALTAEPGPWEVGTEPVFFRFGLPEEVLQSGETCPGDLGLVVIRVTGEPPAEAVVLRAENVDTGTAIEFEAMPVTVPGEEDAGSFFNAVVSLPGPGRWEFSVELDGGRSGAYRVAVRAP